MDLAIVRRVRTKSSGYGDTESVERSQHQADFGSRLSLLDFVEPKSADSDRLGKRCLTESEFLTSIADQRPEFGRRPDNHGGSCK